MLHLLLAPAALVVMASSASAAGHDNMSGWKTFSNRAGWSIRHPRNWTLSSCRSCSDLTDPDVFVSFDGPSPDSGIMVEHLVDKPARKTTDQWMEEIIHSANLNLVLSKEWITVSNVRALRVRYRNTSIPEDMEVVYIVRNNDTFSISAFNINNAHSYGIYRRMLSTFQFHKAFPGRRFQYMKSRTTTLVKSPGSRHLTHRQSA
jgi:hypothetical protein